MAEAKAREEAEGDDEPEPIEHDGTLAGRREAMAHAVNEANETQGEGDGEIDE